MIGVTGFLVPILHKTRPETRTSPHNTGHAVTASGVLLFALAPYYVCLAPRTHLIGVQLDYTETVE